MIGNTILANPEALACDAARIVLRRLQTSDRYAIVKLLAGGLLELDGEEIGLLDFWAVPEVLARRVVRWAYPGFESADRAGLVLDGELFGFDDVDTLIRETLPPEDASIQRARLATALAHRCLITDLSDLMKGENPSGLAESPRYAEAHAGRSRALEANRAGISAAREITRDKGLAIHTRRIERVFCQAIRGGCTFWDRARSLGFSSGIIECRRRHVSIELVRRGQLTPSEETYWGSSRSLASERVVATGPREFVIRGADILDGEEKRVGSSVIEALPPAPWWKVEPS